MSLLQMKDYLSVYIRHALFKWQDHLQNGIPGSLIIFTHRYRYKLSVGLSLLLVAVSGLTAQAKPVYSLVVPNTVSVSFSQSDIGDRVKLVSSEMFLKKDRLISLAQSFVGKTPYAFGSTPSGWDCSGFTKYLYKKVFGLELEHSATKQSLIGEQLESIAHASKGDLVLFKNKSFGEDFYHVGIYDGKGKVYHALNKKAGTVHTSLNFNTSSKFEDEAFFFKII